MDTKICNCCHLEQDKSNFYKKRAKCKPCFLKIRRERYKEDAKNSDFRINQTNKTKKYYKNHREERLDYAFKWKCENPKKYLLDRAKIRAEKDGLEFNIDESDIIIPEFCPILGVKLEFIRGEINNSPSIDRIDSNLGYIKGNIAVISHKANGIKKDYTLEYWQKKVMIPNKIIEYIMKHS